MLIRHKLLVGFGALSLLSAGAGFIAIHINGDLKADLAQIEQASLLKPASAERMRESLLAIRFRVDHLQAEERAAIASRSIVPLSIRKSIGAEIEADLQQFEEGFRSCYQATVRGVELAREQAEPEEIQAAQDELELLKSIQTKFDPLKENLRANLQQTNDLTAALNASSHGGYRADLNSLVGQYQEGATRQLKQEIDDIEEGMRRAAVVELWITIAVFTIGAVIAWVVGRTLSKPLRALARAANRIGAGELDTTVDIRSKDEIGLLATTFNRMTADLRSTTVSRDYVDRILKSMADPLIVVTNDGAIQSVNEATLKLLGYTEPELIGKPIEAVLRSPQKVSLLHQAREKGFLSGIEVNYLAKSGAPIAMSFSASVIREHGEATGLVCVAQDITERKRAESELEKVHKQLMLASRQAGMAEVATSVLHNVGNVLNSINVSSTLVAEGLRRSKAENLTKIVALLDEHADHLGQFLTADDKGRKLPTYFRVLRDELSTERQTMLAEVELLRRNIEHIKDIVSMQQSYAKIFGIVETVEVSDLVEDALRMNAGALVRHDVKVTREFQEGPPVTVEKHKVLQVLVNLIRNAKYACDEGGCAEKQMTVKILHAGERVRISVIDNGIGIPAENFQRIFNHGFTTRKDGHGFGLHSGALAAKEMGGTLTAQSDGVGRGATFILEIPRTAPGETISASPTKAT